MQPPNDVMYFLCTMVFEQGFLFIIPQAVRFGVICWKERRERAGLDLWHAAPSRGTRAGWVAHGSERGERGGRAGARGPDGWHAALAGSELGAVQPKVSFNRII